MDQYIYGYTYKIYRYKPFTRKKAGRVAQGIGPKVKPQYYKRKINKKLKSIN
jgi:hypothetical protein